MPMIFGLREPLSVVGDGSWRLSLIPEHTPVHFMVPVDDGGETAILVSIDGHGNHTKSDPYASMPVIRGGRITATASFGTGPLIFVHLDTDGKYYYDDMEERPAARFGSIEEFIKAACAAMRRPCAYRLSPHFRHEDAPLRQLDDSSSSICPQAEAVTPPSSPIFARLQLDWGLEFYIRVDHGGSFHTYPDVGGPFQSIEEAEKVIDQYLHVRRVPKMCIEQAGVSRQEIGMRRILFWPDGTMKRRTKSYMFQKGLEHMRRLVRAVVDQYNEDHNLVGALAYEVKDVTHQSFYEEDVRYRHLNFTAKSKRADGLDCWFDKQFFVELTNTKQEGMERGEWVVSCFRMVETNDNGYCACCRNGVKHPNKAEAYTGGHVGAEKMLEDPYPWSDSDEDETSRERRIRRKYDYPRKPFVYPACAVPKPTASMN
ncbi:unnamed protein product [Alopecurus aequalis]